MLRGLNRRCGNFEDPKVTKKERAANAPKSLPKHRPRSLTSPLVHDPEHGFRGRLWNSLKRSSPQQTLAQSQSSLIARLPREVRQIIWNSVLGGHFLHVVRAQKRLVAIDCVENAFPGANTFGHTCWGAQFRSPSVGPTPGIWLHPRLDSAAKAACLLPLLRTCRIM